MFITSFTMLSITSCGDDGPTSTVTPNDTSTDDDDKPQSNELELLRTCTSCMGSLECENCGGSGHGCETCNNTGKFCPDCKTTGRHPDCHGTGMCSKCSGDGWRNCDFCLKAPGVCTNCYGAGTSFGRTCALCGGLGDCKHCRGHKGKSGERCWTCDGTGDCTCDNGKCPKCNGTANCWRCGGDAHCALCSGTGRCRYCDEKGYMNIQSSLYFESTGGKVTLFVKCSSYWEISADESWVTFSPSSGYGNTTVIATAEPHPGDVSRLSGTVTLTSGEQTVSIMLLQGFPSGETPSDDNPDDDNNPDDDEKPIADQTLKNMLEKPFGILDIDIKTSTYQELKNEITKSYKLIFDKPDREEFAVAVEDNPTLSDFIYQEMPFALLHVDKQMTYYAYTFVIDKSKTSDGFDSYLAKTIQDFKQTMNVTLEKSSTPTYVLADYYGYDEKSNSYNVSIGQNDVNYNFCISVSY